MPRRDYRSPEAEAYRKLYNTTRWRKRRARQFYEQPLCERHLKQGKVVVATVAHHKREHKGDIVSFYEGELESLCKPCHDGEAQQQERRGYSTAIGDDGWPVDPAHPVNR